MKQALPTAVIASLLLFGGVIDVTYSLTSPDPLAAAALLIGFIEIVCAMALIAGYRRTG